MSTDGINRAILLAVVVIAAIAYGLLYSHASTNFRLLVPLGLTFVLGLVVRGEVRDRKR
jgi:hypothetical protein